MNTTTGNQKLLIPELKNYDFFLKLTGPGYEEDLGDTIATIKTIPIVQYVSKVKYDNLKSKYNLLF